MENSKFLKWYIGCVTLIMLLAACYCTTILVENKIPRSISLPVEVFTDIADNLTGNKKEALILGRDAVTDAADSYQLVVEAALVLLVVFLIQNVMVLMILYNKQRAKG